MTNPTLSVIPSVFLQRLALALGLLLVTSTVMAGEVPFSSLSVSSDSAALTLTVLSVDLDGDGDLDTVSWKNDTEVFWSENVSGDGSTWTEHTVATGYNEVFRLASADLDGDGDQDLVSGSESEVRWHENVVGDGSAWTAAAIGDPGGGLITVATADVDGDGDMDVLSVPEYLGAVAWYENTAGDATAWTQHSIAPAGNLGLSAGDIDGDGDIDVAWSYWGSPPARLAWQENLDGYGLSWAEHEITDEVSHLLALHLADVDGDDDLDILGADHTADEALWWENTAGDGTAWTLRAITTALDGASSVKAADFDQDGDLDVLTTAYEADEIAWHENTLGNGTAWIERTLGTEADMAMDSAIGDVDGDGDLDVCAAIYLDSTIGWFENETIHRSAYFPQKTLVHQLPHGSGTVMRMADIDTDGDLDFVAGMARRVVWYENDFGNASSWTEHTVATWSNLSEPRGLHVADLNGDGDPDVIAAETQHDLISWWTNPGTVGGTWTGHQIAWSVDRPESVHAGDFDGDGDLDVVSAVITDRTVFWHENTAGNGSAWTSHVIDNDYLGAVAVAAVDVDSDGDTDVMAGSQARAMKWYENLDGSGSTWTPHALDTANYGNYQLSIADLDGDADLDVVHAHQSQYLGWYENFGTFWVRRSIPVTMDYVYGHAIADLDGDGDADVLATSRVENRVRWYENLNGEATAWREEELDADVYGPVGVAAGDLDGDGDLDAASFATYSYLIDWYENRGGQFRLETADTAPATMVEGASDDVLRIVVGHNGRTGDTDVEIASFELLFEEAAGDPLTTAEANAMIDELHIHIDDGSGQFEESLDTAIATLESLTLVDGVQTVTLADDDPDCRVTLAETETYFVVVELRLDSGEQPLRTFRVSHLTESSSSAEDVDHDIALSLEYVPDASSSLIDIPLVIPAAAGAASDGDPWTETSLTMRRAENGDVILDFGPSCLANDEDYAVYEGPVGDFTSHEKATCTTGGAQTATLEPEEGDRYYLVVPLSENREGSYGLDGDGAERPQSLSPCRAQALGQCPVVVPENDLCLDAIPLDLDTSTIGTTVDATGPDAAPFSGCAITAPGVWYSVIGTGNTLTASTCNAANYDTKISIFCNGCDEQQMIAVACNDDVVGCSGFSSEISWCSEAAVEYLIFVHGFMQETGSFILTLTDTGESCTPDVNCSGVLGQRF